VQTVTVETWIDAPPERCFDAARDLDQRMLASRAAVIKEELER